MTDDIVTRLRGSWDCSCLYIKEHGLDRKCLDCEAADEIERLRENAFKWRAIAEGLYECAEGRCPVDCVTGEHCPVDDYREAVRDELRD